MQFQPTIIFATSNEGKIHSMKKWVKSYGIKVKKLSNQKILRDFDEPQEGSIEEIALKKILYFRDSINKPFVVQDSGFFLKAKNGFPGRYVKPILEDLGLTGLLNLVPPDNRECYFRDILAFWSPTYEEVKSQYKKSLKYYPAEIFASEVHGRLAEQPAQIKRKEMWSELWTVFIPDGFTVTLSEMNKLENEKFQSLTRNNPDNNCFLKFANWIQSNYQFLYRQGELFESIR